MAAELLSRQKSRGAFASYRDSREKKHCFEWRSRPEGNKRTAKPVQTPLSSCCESAPQNLNESRAVTTNLLNVPANICSESLLSL